MPPTTLNSEEPDKVNQLDNRAEVIPYFKFRKKISGLAEIDM